MNLLAVLGFAVFERVGAGSFKLRGPAPGWLPVGPLERTFPFLEVFLPDAEEFWAAAQGYATLQSDLWTQDDRHFGATAVAGEQKFLIIERAGARFEQTQRVVQYAHEVSLARDQIAKLSRELERATEAKSEFLARMSHEIRTPLNALLGMAELLAETPLNDEQSRYVRIFRRAGDNLLTVINDVLDLSKVEAGQIELESIDFDLTEVLTEALEIAGVRARAKGLEIASRVEPVVPLRLNGDPGRLRQILLNLLGNATKFTEHGEIAVLVKQDGPGTLHFAVSDTGIGIPPDRLSSIFDNFSQADASTARRYGGTGLGLSISKRFVELMGGKIWAESAPGAGTTIHFTARLPAAESAAATPGPGVAPAPAISPLRILLADDSEENRFLIRGYLKESGSVIDEVENGAQAVERFERDNYDLVLMDSEMPVLDGYSATQQMRAFEKEHARARAPIFSLTAHALREARERSLAAGCTEHLTKPIKKAALLDAICRHAGAPQRTEVAVESWLQPVVGRYLENRRADVGKLRAALEAGDYTTIRTLGHQMAGSGGGYGFDPITEIGGALEESALVCDAARIRAAVEDLAIYLSRVQPSPV